LGPIDARLLPDLHLVCTMKMCMRDGCVLVRWEGRAGPPGGGGCVCGRVCIVGGLELDLLEEAELLPVHQGRPHVRHRAELALDRLDDEALPARPARERRSDAGQTLDNPPWRATSSMCVRVRRRKCRRDSLIPATAS
jgi:hypothetical protein